MATGQRPLLIRHEGEPWRSPEVHAYSDERALQQMLRDSPQLLALCSEGSVFVDEMTVPLVGSVDLAGVGPNGDITLIECKLEANPEIRRSIVGQAFAYASGLWRMSYEDFDRIFSARSDLPLVDAVRNSLPKSTPDWSEGQFRANVVDNLAAGRFTLVLAVDRITEELKRLVPFVNAHTVDDIRFIALELGYVRDGDVEVVLPSTYGEESAREKQTSQRRAWPVEAYFEALRRYEPAAQDFIDEIVGFSRENGAELEGGSGAGPSLNVRFRFGSTRKAAWRSAFYKSGPSFELNFYDLRSVVSVDMLRACVQIMSTIDGVGEKYAALEPDFSRYPTLAIESTLTQPGAAETVKRALAIVLEV